MDELVPVPAVLVSHGMEEHTLSRPSFVFASSVF
jgi:hypothetical protein